jgi:hypothetical protein
MGNVKPEISKPMTVSLLSRNCTVDAYNTLKPGLYKDINLVNVVCLTPGGRHPAPGTAGRRSVRRRQRNFHPRAGIRSRNL